MLSAINSRSSDAARRTDIEIRFLIVDFEMNEGKISRCTFYRGACVVFTVKGFTILIEEEELLPDHLDAFTRT